MKSSLLSVGTEPARCDKESGGPTTRPWSSPALVLCTCLSFACDTTRVVALPGVERSADRLTSAGQRLGEQRRNRGFHDPRAIWQLVYGVRLDHDVCATAMRDFWRCAEKVADPTAREDLRLAIRVALQAFQNDVRVGAADAASDACEMLAELTVHACPRD